MLRKFYDCPKCGAKDEAKVSSTYPDVVVHKCHGKALLEVGLFQEGKVISLSVVKEPLSNFKWETRNFVIEKVADVQELMTYGKTLGNLTQDKDKAEYYLNKPNSTVLVVKVKYATTAEYMILLDNGQIPDRQHFSGKNHSYIPQVEGSEIIKKLIEEKLIPNNPFPQDYP